MEKISDRSGRKLGKPIDAKRVDLTMGTQNLHF